MKKMCNVIDFLIKYSCNIKSCDTVYINFFGEENDFLQYLLKRIHEIGAKYILKIDSNKELNNILNNLTIEKVNALAEEEVKRIKQCNVYISLVADEVKINEKLEKEYFIYQNYYKKIVRDTRLKYCRWLGLKLPTNSMANLVNMKFHEFEKLFYEACDVDYIELEKQNLKLAHELERTKKIRIIAQNTDFSFTKEGIPSRILCGKINLPDGEIYTSPNKYSVNGVIKFNTTCLQAGDKFENIKLAFKNGKVIKAECSYNALKLNNILNSDEGAGYIGEFAIGINEKIRKPIGLILFDEKIKGSIHIAMGQSYKDAYNGNDSSLHWDMVLDMNKESGGGKIFFDDNLVFEDGEWFV